MPILSRIIALLFCLCCLQQQPLYAQPLAAGTFAFTTSDSIGLRVKIAGKGPVCFFIHGGPGQGCRSFEQLKGSELEKCFTMVYLDQRGSGLSQDAANYHLPRMLADIEELRRHLGLKHIYLLAHSFGGIIAFNYARQYPGNVSGLILANATLHANGYNALLERVQYQFQLLGKNTVLTPGIAKDSLTALEQENFAALRQRKLGYKMLTDDTATVNKQMTVDDYERTIDFGMRILSRQNEYPEYFEDYTPATRELKVPVLVIAGTQDHAIGTRTHLAFAFPNATVKVIPGGHMLYYENSPAFVKAVCSFLAR
jgi:proline iminopeptidase